MCSACDLGMFMEDPEELAQIAAGEYTCQVYIYDNADDMMSSGLLEGSKFSIGKLTVEAVGNKLRIAYNGTLDAKYNLSFTTSKIETGSKNPGGSHSFAFPIPQQQSGGKTLAGVNCNYYYPATDHKKGLFYGDDKDGYRLEFGIKYEDLFMRFAAY
jgi:hypothetical protein